MFYEGVKNMWLRNVEDKDISRVGLGRKWICKLI